ncbi:MAG: hypothetical protein Q7T80_06720 [Methanoregula sp.]|nr:hypothetical protein [Methanoregula sp.]
MDNLNLNSDEAILQKTQTIIIDGTRHEAVLTGRRLILVESETGRIHEDIPFTDIRMAISGVNKLREPVITISFNSSEREKRTLELIFIREILDQNIKELEKCLALLKQHNVPVEGKTLLAEEVHTDRGERASTGVLAVDEKTSRAAVPEWSFISTLHQIKKPLKEEAPEHSPLVLIAAVVLIIAIFVGGALIAGQVMHPIEGPANQSVTSAVITSTVVPSPLPSPTSSPQPQETPGTESYVPPVTVPISGVWVKVSYPGNYTGYIGATGRHIEINASGTRLYQLPVDDAMIEGSIEKLDGSAEKLEVGIYNGGTLVSKSETQKPWGLIDIHNPVGPAIGGAVIPTPLPEIQVSPYASLPPASIPPTGVWVRVFYPGNFMGSIGANGLMRAVNSTGDQLYQFPITNGMIDGSVEKMDGSVDNLILEVYKDGALMSQSYTSVPLGLLDVHTAI